MIEALPLPLGSPAHPTAFEEIPTVDDLFQRLRAAAASDPLAFEVEFDDLLGYPRRGSWNISAEIADDEYAFEVSEVQDATPVPFSQ